MPKKETKLILIVEDEKAYAKALVLKLQNAGFEAESVANGEEALSAIARGHYDLILCDLIMPKMNGFTLLEKLKKQKCKIPVIVLSNLNQVDDENKARSLGAVDFLAKSNIPISDVIIRVEQLIGTSKKTFK